MKKGYRLMLPAVLGILLCLTCLAGFTLSWLQDTLSVPTQKTEAGYFHTRIYVTDTEDLSPVEPMTGMYHLTPGREYRVTLIGEGTAPGYWILSMNQKTPVIASVPVGETFTVTLQAGERGGALTVGSYLGSETGTLINGGSYRCTAESRIERLIELQME